MKFFVFIIGIGTGFLAGTVGASLLSAPLVHAQLAGGPGISQLQQFTSTTSPASAITQSTYGKTLRLTGLDCTAFANGGKLTASANGTVSCASDSSGGGGGGTFPLSADTNYGQVVYSTSTPTLWFKSGVFASSTSFFVNATSSQQTITSTLWFPLLTSGELAVDANGKVYKGATSTLANISGTLGTAGGGTGLSNPGSVSTEAILSFAGVGGASAIGATVSNGVLISNGTSWQMGTVALGSANAVSGDLAFSNLAQGAANTVLANRTSATGDFAAVATSTLFGQPTPGFILAFNGGQWIGVATSTNSCGSGVTCTFSNGTWSFTGSGGGGGTYPFVPLVSFGTTTSATSSALWAMQGIFASSTSRFVYASTTQLTVSANAEIFGFASSTQFLAKSGTGNPAFAFNDDSNTGIDTAGADILSFITNSSSRLSISASGIQPATNINIDSGFGGSYLLRTVNPPNCTSSLTYSFSGVANTGMCQYATGVVGLAGAGVLTAIFSNASTTLIGNATTTGTFFATTASSTNLFGASLATCSGSQFLQWSAGLFSCATPAAGGTPGGTDKQVQFNDGGSTFAGAVGLIWDKLTSFLGVSSTTPWGVLSVASSTYNYTVPLFAVATSSLNTGGLLTIFGTSTTASVRPEFVSYPQSGARVTIGNNQYAKNNLSTLFVDGTLDSTWSYDECNHWPDLAGFPGTPTLIDFVCGFMSFSRNNTTSNLASLQTAVASGRSGVTLFLDTATGNSYATLLVGSNNQFSNMTAYATTTPILEVAGGIADKNAASQIVYIGLTQQPYNGAATQPTDGCYFTASTTEANWKAVCAAASVYTIVDTGIPTSTKSDQTKFRLEYDKNNSMARFYMKGSVSSTTQQVAVITTNLPATTALLSEKISLTAIATTAGTARKFDLFGVRFWTHEEIDILP